MAHEVSLDAFNQLRGDVDTLEAKVYKGNGESLMSRMNAAERSLATLTRFGWLAIGAMFTTCGLIVADLITRLLK